jgi:prepilin-type N-terminal cleavage/methylation domain-containing protein/prepilin-type processing-associated H-X9-DG protein
VAQKILRATRQGFTLIELLVSIAIIGVLISLLGPAVQKAREAARRTECENRIRQLGLGVSLFHDSFQIIPTNGGPDPESTLQLVGGPAIVPSTHELSSGITYLWGVGDPRLTGRPQTGSWLYSILPKIEQSAAHDSGDCDAFLPLYLCPSRPRGKSLGTVDDVHASYVSDGIAMSKTDFAGNSETFTGRPNAISFRSIQDGLSQTILAGEKAFDPTVQTEASWYWDEPVWLGGSKGTIRGGIRIVPDGVGIEFRDHWGSQHDGGAYFVFADGHVQFVTSSVDWKLMSAALTIRGSETETIPP